MTHVLVRKATKSYQQVDAAPLQVLDGVNFQMASGKITALVGPSGCGKSTFLNVLVNLEKLDSGEITFTGRDGKTVQRPTIGYVFQSPRLLPWKTVRKNIHLALSGAGIARPEWDKRVDKYLEIVSLSDFADTYPLYLSGGMRQRAGLARALAVEADVILMDEPFASVDELTARRLREATRSICEVLQKTVLFVTHNLNEAAFLGDKIVVLSQRPASVIAEISHSLAAEREWGHPDIVAVAKEVENLVLKNIP